VFLSILSIVLTVCSLTRFGHSASRSDRVWNAPGRGADGAELSLTELAQPDTSAPMPVSIT
jgi:hypothetical protein